jgi:hypothetical protein
MEFNPDLRGEKRANKAFRHSILLDNVIFILYYIYIITLYNLEVKYINKFIREKERVFIQGMPYDPTICYEETGKTTQKPQQSPVSYSGPMYGAGLAC